MKLGISQIAKTLFVCLLIGGLTSCNRKLTSKFTFDPNLLISGIHKFQPPFDFMYQYPEDQDSLNYRTYSYLITRKPTSQNYDIYVDLACSLWELDKLEEAEQMFLNIISSEDEYYTTTYYHSSDIPGDTTVSTYGYGSYTSNYKNSAAIYLAKIYIKQNRFEEAFRFMEDATKKYKVTYTCGTGFHRQKDLYDYLYARCYEGLGQYDKVLELLFPECLDRNDEIIVRVIKKKYSPDEIKQHLLKAETSIQCKFDTLPSYGYSTTHGSDKKPERTDTLVYYSGSATVDLFDNTVDIPTPRLENGERVTKERFLKEFKESSFYVELAKIAGLS